MRFSTIFAVAFGVIGLVAAAPASELQARQLLSK